MIFVRKGIADAVFLTVVIGVSVSRSQVLSGIDNETANDHPRIRHVFMVAPDIVALKVEARALPRIPLQPYEKEAGDEIQLNPGKVPLRLAEIAGVAEYDPCMH